MVTRPLTAWAMVDATTTRAMATAAKVFVIALGVIAALNQVGVALTVTMPVLIAVLATAAGILIVGAGGGLIKPAQAKWETYLANTEAAVTEPEVNPDTEEIVDEVEVDEVESRQTHKATIVVTTKERD